MDLNGNSAISFVWSLILTNWANNRDPTASCKRSHSVTKLNQWLIETYTLIPTEECNHQRWSTETTTCRTKLVEQNLRMSSKRFRNDQPFQQRFTVRTRVQAFKEPDLHSGLLTISDHIASHLDYIRHQWLQGARKLRLYGLSEWNANQSK